MPPCDKGVVGVPGLWFLGSATPVTDVAPLPDGAQYNRCSCMRNQPVAPPRLSGHLPNQLAPHLLHVAGQVFIVNQMVNYSDQQLDRIFTALAHPIRRGILARLSGGAVTVAEAAEPFAVSAPAITKHMRILEDAGLVSREKHGRAHHCRVEQRQLAEAERWIEEQRQFWNTRLDALEQYLKENP